MLKSIIAIFRKKLAKRADQVKHTIQNNQTLTLSSLPKKDPYKIVIYGCNDFSNLLFQLISDDNIEVLCFLDAESSLTTFNDKKVCNIAEFKINPDYKDVPIIIATPHVLKRSDELFLDFESLYQFKLCLQALKNIYQLPNFLLHPAALVDLLDVNFQQKPIIFGLQGAGNTLFNHIFLQLSVFKKDAFSDKAKFFTKLCLEYRHAINLMLTDLLQASGGVNHHLVPWKMGTTYVNCTIENTLLSIFSIYTREHITNQSYVYHQIPSQTYLEVLKKSGFLPFYVLRCPLDMLLSVLNKNGAIDKQTRTIDKKQFVITSRWLIEQLALWHEYSTSMPVLHYEKLINDPIVTIKQMMLAIGVNLSQKEIENIWNKVGFKQLPKAPSQHFWQGGNGKWEAYFQPCHLSFLKKFGMEKLLANYGYTEALARFKKLTRAVSDEDWREELDEIERGVNFSVDICTGNETRDTKQFLQAFYGEENYRWLDSLHVTCTDGPYPEKIDAMLKNVYLKEFIQAGVLREKRFI